MNKSILPMIMCLTLLTPSFANAQSVLIKKNVKAPFDGYLFDTATGKDIAEGWSKAEANAKTYRAAYEDLKRETAESAAVIDAIIEADRAKYRRKQKEAKSKARWNSISWFIIGGTLGAVIHNNR